MWRKHTSNRYEVARGYNGPHDHSDTRSPGSPNPHGPRDPCVGPRHPAGPPPPRRPAAPHRRAVPSRCPVGPSRRAPRRRAVPSGHAAGPSHRLDRHHVGDTAASIGPDTPISALWRGPSAAKPAVGRRSRPVRSPAPAWKPTHGTGNGRGPTKIVLDPGSRGLDRALTPLQPGSSTILARETTTTGIEHDLGGLIARGHHYNQDRARSWLAGRALITTTTWIGRDLVGGRARGERSPCAGPYRRAFPVGGVPRRAAGPQSGWRTTGQRVGRAWSARWSARSRSAPGRGQLGEAGCPRRRSEGSVPGEAGAGGDGGVGLVGEDTVEAQAEEEFVFGGDVATRVGIGADSEVHREELVLHAERPGVHE